MRMRSSPVKPWSWLVVIVLALLPACAPGYSAPKPAYPAPAPAFQGTEGWFQNQETESQQESRIWREESGR
jgi:hypothetical protein